MPPFTSCSYRSLPKHLRTPRSLRDFFKCLPLGVTTALAGQWSTYCEKWPTIPDRLKALPIGAFWEHPEVTGLFPSGCGQIVKLALYWASFPVSNVSMERVFGIMRASEGPQRASLSPESLREELMLKVNAHIVEDMLAARARRIP